MILWSYDWLLLSKWYTDGRISSRGVNAYMCPNLADYPALAGSPQSIASWFWHCQKGPPVSAPKLFPGPGCHFWAQTPLTQAYVLSQQCGEEGHPTSCHLGDWCTWPSLCCPNEAARGDVLKLVRRICRLSDWGLTCLLCICGTTLPPLPVREVSMVTSLSHGAPLPDKPFLW